MMKTCPVDGPVKLLPMAASFSLVSEASCLMYNNLFLKKVKGSVLRGTGVGKGVCVCVFELCVFQEMVPKARHHQAVVFSRITIVEELISCVASPPDRSHQQADHLD